MAQADPIPSMHCPQCGKALANQAVFCSYCGRDVKAADSTSQFPFEVLFFGVLALKRRKRIGFVPRILSLVWLTAYILILAWVLLLWTAFAFANRWALDVREIESFALFLALTSVFGTLLNFPLALSARGKSAHSNGISFVGIALLFVSFLNGVLTWTMDRNIQEAILNAREESRQQALYKELDRIPMGGVKP